MTLRLIEFILPQSASQAMPEWRGEDDILGRWEERLEADLVLVRVLVRAEQAEATLDDLEMRFQGVAEFRTIVLPVEATLPRPPDVTNENGEKKKSPERISREELYNDVVQSATITRVFIAQTFLATLVAAVGLVRNETAVLIGAMVIAPLLGPNVSLCLATTLGDFKLALRSLRTNVIGLLVALATSLFIGFLFSIDAEGPAIQSRTLVSGGDIILALAAGCAGVLAFTTGAPSSLIGVMVAVALLPPFAVFGLLLANGEYQAASGALLLVATNVICVNLAGVLTFVVQGLRPRTWWEARRATRATWGAVATWACLLLVLVGLMFLAHRSTSP